jgi:dolichyl-phosphate beta-glucosyltransferase
MTTTARLATGRPVDGSQPCPASDPLARPSDGDAGASGGLRSLLVAGAGYLVLSFLLWGHVWTSHPTSTTTCGCGDSSLFTWFLAWPAYAISHGINPLYSTALFHPTGINLLSNTAEVGIGVVLAPITWLFGPVATLNVALLLSPFLSALAMFVLVRRWVSWAPAAFVAGLLYGFSPFILIALTDAHLMLGMAPIPPLMVACLDEVLVRQRRTPLVGGVVLGLLVAVQFFIGTEVLTITLIVVGIGILLLFCYGLWHRELLRRRARHAVIGLAVAGGATAVLLAYPAWFALAGPAHLSGPIWGPLSLNSYGGTNLEDYLLPSPPSPGFVELAHRFGGYQAPTLSGQYFGIALLAVLVIGVIVWWRDRRLWLFGILAAISVPLSSGLQFHGWSLWRLFVRLPEMDNIIPSRFLIVTYLAVAVMLGIIVDHVHGGVDRWEAARDRRWMGAVVAVAVAAVALVPIVSYYSDGVPLTTQPVVLPTWFETVAPHLVGKQVILALPAPFSLFQSPMTWQAVDGMSYAMVGGGGPDSLIGRAGKEMAGQTAIGNLSISAVVQPITPEEITAVRQALDGWGVTTVVVPDPTPLPGYERLHLVRTAAMVMTAATGRQPIRQADAWVWTGLDPADPPVLSSAARFDVCGARLPPGGTVASIDRSTACVLGGPVVHA